MGYGVDRGGGREAKGGSLRRSKKNPGAAAARQSKCTRAATMESSESLPAPPLVHPDHPHIDCGAALLSRQLDVGRDRLLDRAVEEGCGAVIAWCGEYDRQAKLAAMCAEKPGVLYCALGVHPDNVDRTNQRAHAGWIESIAKLAKQNICVAVLSGLNLARDHATHFSQEALLRELAKTAGTLRLPLVLHLASGHGTVERALEILAETSSESDSDEEPPTPPTAIILHNAVAACASDPSLAARVSEARWCPILTTAHLDVSSPHEEALEEPVDTALLQSAKQCVGILGDRERTVIATNSPWNTPQQLADEYLRTLPNEPSNVSATVATVMPILSPQDPQFLRSNAIALFGLDGQAPRGPGVTVSEKPTALQEDNPQTPDAPAVVAEVVTPDSPEDAITGPADAAPGSAEPSGNEGSHTAAGAVRVAAVSAVRYTCVKCRATLFPLSALVTHSAEAPMATFSRAAKRGHHSGECSSALFVGVLSEAPNIVIDDGVATCRNCTGKVGGAGIDTACPCGRVVPGSTARITATRVERNDDTLLSESALAARAAAELEAFEAKAHESSDIEEPSKKKKEAKKNVKAQNKSNMGDFRNKSASSRELRSLDAMQDDAVSMKPTGRRKKGKKGKRGGASSDDE